MISSIWPKPSVARRRPAMRSTRAARRLPGFPADFFNGRLQSLRREANGMRKTRMQNQEFGDALRLHVRRVRLAIGLERGAGAQQSDPLQIDAFGPGLAG